MKQNRKFPKVFITKKGEASVLRGHPWVYEGEVVQIDGEFQDGEIVDVFSPKEKYLGSGFINSHSKIRIRLISRNANDLFDDAFWRRRIEYAWSYRKTVMGDDLSCCRIIFGEADQIPGLTVDRFQDILVVQVLSLGIEKIKYRLFPLLVQVLQEDGEEIRGIYERNDVKIRLLEGMQEEKGWYPLAGMDTPEETVTRIFENGISYLVDFENGQKTGFFLDQKYNRREVAKICKEKKVLDCFTHTGSFALNAAYGGAKEVTAVDISKTALETADINIDENNLSHIVHTLQMDIFDLLKELEEKHDHSYDVIILDPPAFTKSRDTVTSAMRGYKEINYRAMKLLPRGGYLVTCSCSHFATDELFRKMLQEAAIDAGVNLREVLERKQAPDHPILWNVKETEYLKFYIFQVV